VPDIARTSWYGMVVYFAKDGAAGLQALCSRCVPGTSGRTGKKTNDHLLGYCTCLRSHWDTLGDNMGCNERGGVCNVVEHELGG
jgi:hypothetical protein